MTEMMYDPDAVYQDADILQAQYEAEGQAAAARRAGGLCDHGWQLGGRPAGRFNATPLEIAEMRDRGNFPNRPTAPEVTDQASIPAGEALCLDCGELVDDWRVGRGV